MSPSASTAGPPIWFMSLLLDCSTLLRPRQARKLIGSAEVLVLGHVLAGDEACALRVGEDRHPHPGGVKGRRQHLAAELRRLLGRRVGVVDREGDAPVRWRVGLV